MSSGYIFLYLGNDVAPDLGVFESLFKPIGLRLENPSTNEIVTLSTTGNQIIASREAIESQLVAGRTVSFQWWYSDSDDVYCRFNPQSAYGQWSVELGLDGVASETTDALVATIVRFFTRRCAHGDMVALVVDRTGQFEEVDWGVVIEGKELLQFVPDILVLPRGVSTPGFDDLREELNDCPRHAMLKRR